MLREDFLLNPDGDFPLQDTIVAGVYKETPYGYSDNQHKADLIIYDAGSIKEYPTIGFGVRNYVSGEFSIFDVEKKLRQTMNSDGYDIRNGAISPEQGGSGFFIETGFITNNY